MPLVLPPHIFATLQRLAFLPFALPNRLSLPFSISVSRPTAAAIIRPSPALIGAQSIPIYGFRTGFSFSFITILLESFKSVKPLFKIFTMNRTFARYPFKKNDKMLLQKLFISYKKDLCRNNTSLPFLKFAIFKS